MANRILQIIPENGKVFAILIGEDGVERRLRVKMWALVRGWEGEPYIDAVCLDEYGELMLAGELHDFDRFEEDGANEETNKA